MMDDDMRLSKEKEKKLKRFCANCNKEKGLRNFWIEKCGYYSYRCKKCRDII